jgi:hypothetical protein
MQIPRALAALAMLLLTAPWAVAQPVDRIERFRELVLRDGREAVPPRPESDRGVVAELYALVDDEILENLRSGAPFASVAFIQERLDAFGAAWGGAQFRVARFGAPGDPAPLTVGLFSLSGVAGSGSLRLYGPPGPGVTLLAQSAHDGTPEFHPWPAAPGGRARFLALWSEAPSGRGVRALHAELWDRTGPDTVARAWSSAEAFPDGLWAVAWKVGAGELVIRHELRYPGWKPGCTGQTEAEDVLRPTSPSGVPVLARRQLVNAWHRELGAATSRFFSALATGDARALAGLVPNAALRARLPAGLRPEPACDQQNPDASTVVVAATDEGSGRRSPWSLWWRRGPRGWRLAAAAPVLQ